MPQSPYVPTIICLDMGNTMLKAAVVTGGNVVVNSSWLYGGGQLPWQEEAEALAVLRHWKHHYQPHGVVWSSVSDQQLPWELQELFPLAQQITNQVAMPFRNAYETPHTLGIDRLLGMAGALHHIGPAEAALVIDMGTCITVDYLDAERTYQGGSISAGWQLQLKAMHHFTQRLPLLEGKPPEHFTGKTTAACMQSGAWQSVVGLVNGSIAHYRTLSPQLKVFVCGGDAAIFESELNGPIFVVPHLVMQGLYQLYILHAHQSPQR